MDVAKVRVRTRAEVPAMSKDSSGRVKRRKVGDGELSLSSSSLTNEFHVICKFSPQASNSQGDAIVAKKESSSSYSNLGSDGGASCCSSNGSAEASTHKLNSTNLEESVAIEALSSTKYNSSESVETTPVQSGETLRPKSTSVTSYRRHQAVTTEKFMPSEAEVEEFFAVAEKKLREQFIDKYNYDISKDEPLGGRYEWVPLKP